MSFLTLMRRARATGIVLVGALTTTLASAHEGHGAGTTHWHATDVWGFVALAIVVAGALAWWRGRP